MAKGKTKKKAEKPKNEHTIFDINEVINYALSKSKNEDSAILEKLDIIAVKLESIRKTLWRMDSVRSYENKDSDAAPADSDAAPAEKEGE